MSDEVDFLIVDDDERFRERLLKAFRKRGLAVVGAANYEEARALALQHRLRRALVDLRMPGPSGLALLKTLLELHPDLEAVVLTGFGSIATAVDAMRLGAHDYLTKPCDADRILAAFACEPTSPETELAFETPSLARIEREHIERVLQDCSGNVSKAARVLGIHRRTLQYKLAKFPVAR